MVGTQKTLEENNPSDKFLSLPDTLNMSVVVEPSISKDIGGAATGSGTNVDTSTLAFFLGGRIGEHMGTFIEIGYSADTQSWGLGNLVLPITYKIGDNTYGVVPFNTDGHGSTASFELLTTVHGAISGINGRHPAQGVGIYVYNENFYANYTAWSNGNKSSSEAKLASSFRAVYTPMVAGWDLAFGAQYMTGTTNQVDGNDAAIAGPGLSTDSYTVDFQALGKLGNLPIDFAASYGDADSDTTGAGSVYAANPNDANDRTAFVTHLEVGVMPRVLVAVADFARTDDGTNVVGQDATNNAETLGVRYFFMQNVFAETDITFNSSNQESDKSLGLAMNIAF